MPSAYSMIRDLPHYRREAFAAGLISAGYVLVKDRPVVPHADDLLVIWNRYGRFETAADFYERFGAKVVVAENGYLGVDHCGRQLYAIAKRHHNGAGAWPSGDGSRWAALGIDLAAWRKRGDHILVLPQRGIGPAGVGMPKDWPLTIVSRLKALTDRPIRLRPHPGKDRPSLAPDLRDCWAVVTWGSGAAIKAIVAGIPVFHEMPNWIGGPAAVHGFHDLERPFLGDRAPMFHRLAWAQWTVEDIETGEPFRWLLS